MLSESQGDRQARPYRARWTCDGKPRRDITVGRRTRQRVVQVIEYDGTDEDSLELAVREAIRGQVREVAIHATRSRTQQHTGCCVFRDMLFFALFAMFIWVN